MCFLEFFFKDAFLSGAPNGSIGFAAKNGWMTQEIFLEVMKHVQKKTCASTENPILIILDNHESHISINLINFARENGIVMLTFPPHTSHRLQPLDVSVFSPFKNRCKAEFNSWVSKNPGKTISIYNVAGLSALAYDNSFTRQNILAGFKKSGIVPYDRNIFKEDEFAPSKVTEHPPPQAQTSEDCQPNQNTPDISEIEPLAGPSGEVSVLRSNVNEECLNYPARVNKTTNNSTTAMSPEEVRPFPKSQPRKTSRRGRKKGKTCVLTDTPEKNRIEEEHKLRMEKKAKLSQKSCKRKLILCKIKKESIKKSRKSTINKKYTQRPSTSDTDDLQKSIDTDKEGELSPIDSEESESEDECEEVKEDGRNININDFVLVKLC